jgi:hypothetical protein
MGRKYQTWDPPNHRNLITSHSYLLPHHRTQLISTSKNILCMSQMCGVESHGRVGVASMCSSLTHGSDDDEGANGHGSPAATTTTSRWPRLGRRARPARQGWAGSGSAPPAPRGRQRGAPWCGSSTRHQRASASR